MKRFWTLTHTTPVEQDYAVLLDDKPVRIPGGGEIRVPFRGLAEAIAAEWAGISGEFTPEDLPLTRLAATALARTRELRPQVARQLAAYGLHDLLCYRATEQALAAHEAQLWQPWLDWAAEHLGVHLQITTGIRHAGQSEAARETLLQTLLGKSDYALTALGLTVPALGSLILGLAVDAGALAPDAAAELAALDELWQERQWGRDEAAATRRAQIRAEILTAAHFARLARG